MRFLHLPRPAALVLALLATLVALGGVVALLAPPVIQQTDGLVAAVPRYLADLDTAIRRLVERYPVLRSAGVASGERGLVTAALLDIADFLRRGILPYVATTGRILIDAVAVVVMALYLALRPAVYREGLVLLVPPRHRTAAREILRDVATTLRAWILAQLTAMAVLGALTAAGLWLLDVPYWLAFGIFAGLAALVPFFGTLVSTLLPALLVLGERGPLVALAVASVGVVVHLIEANLVGPILMHRQVALPPVLTILSVLVMGELAGPVGLIVAVPTLATVIVLVRHILQRHVYGDAVPVAAGSAVPAPGETAPP
jgi:predicted PurR-regulated permease PerM